MTKLFLIYKILQVILHFFVQFFSYCYLYISKTDEGNGKLNQIVRSIHEFGGTVKITSSLNVGTVFDMSFW